MERRRAIPVTKLRLLEMFRMLSVESPNTYMWFAIPGGMISGKPANDYADWIRNTTGHSLQIDNELRSDDPQKLNRYLLLKDASLRQNGVEIIMGAAVVGALEVSAWGYRTPSAR
jgi:hypothetical protein